MIFGLTSQMRAVAHDVDTVFLRKISLFPGLLLLSDVALGKMYERTKAEYVGN